MDDEISDSVVLQALSPNLMFVVQISVADGTFAVCANRDPRLALPPSAGNNYDQVLSALAHDYLLAGDADDAVRDLSLETVTDKLADSDEYIQNVHMFVKAAVRYKRFRFSWRDAKHTAVLLAVWDATDEIAALRERSKEEALAAGYLDTLPLACFIMRMEEDADGTIQDGKFVYTNKMYRRFAGDCLDSGARGCLKRRFGAEMADVAFERFCDTAATGHVHEVECYLPTTKRHLRLSTYRPEVGYCGCVVVDITDEVAMRQQLEERREKAEQEARHDPLTGLLNVRAAKREISKRLKNKQMGEDSYSAMILFDLDDFKAVNDRLGHPMGDALLTSFAEALARTFRSHDVVYRLGGDEFAVFVDDLNMPGLAVRSMYRRVSDALADRFAVLDGSGSFSVGAFVSRSARSYTEFYHGADKALYEGKGDGKGCCRMNLDI